MWLIWRTKGQDSKGKYDLPTSHEYLLVLTGTEVLPLKKTGLGGKIWLIIEVEMARRKTYFGEHLLDINLRIDIRYPPFDPHIPG